MTLAKIVYASMTGNTEEIADIVAEALENLAIEVDINECTQVDADEFEEADICIVATYTSGFCKSVDDFEAAFAKTGAIKGAESVKVDLAAEEEDIQNLEDFAKKIVASL